MENSHDIPKGLCYTCDQEPGFLRRKQGKKFVFHDQKDKILKDPNHLKRIDNLVIPPIWENVWICSKANGHLQVTGTDLKKRKQYIYHEEWIKFSQNNKYNRMEEFGNSLPVIRDRVKKDLRKKGWPREKVLALTVDLMDHYFIRIGNKKYQDENKTFGLTTLRKKHMSEEGNGITFLYKAKSGKMRKVQIKSKKLSHLVKQTSELPGYEIFRYFDKDKKSRIIDSEDVNEYIKSISGHDFTAKDFRTWGGTRLAVENFDKAMDSIQNKKNAKLETALVRLVAQELGNTVATCRKYYIHPKVLSSLMEGHSRTLRGRAKKNLSKSEQVALAIISSK